MLKVSRIAKLAGIAAAAISLGASMAGAQEISLKFGAYAAKTVSFAVPVNEVLIPKAAEYSGGRIEIKYFGGGSLCVEYICGEQMRQGLVDMGQSSAANFGNFGSTYTIVELPYLFKDSETANKIMSEWLGEELRHRALEETGFRVFSVFPSGGFRDLGGFSGPVHVPSDIKGMKIRVTQSPLETMLIQSWGAVPTPLPPNEIVQSLKTGLLDGVFLQSAWMPPLKVYEAQPHVTYTGTTFGAAVVYMDDKRFQSLPDWAQEALNQAFADYNAAAYAYDAGWVDSQRDILAEKAQVYQPTPDEMKLWIDASIGAWKAARGTFDPELARRILEEQGRTDFIKRLEAAGAL